MENTRRKREANEKKLTKFNLNDQEMNEQNAQLNDEMRQLEQQHANEKQQVNEEKQKYRQALDQLDENEHKRKRIEAKMTKVQKTIRILEENIQSELNR